MSLFVSLLAGGLFGLALAAPPGPMNAVIAEESVLRGWTAGFLAGLGAMTADACFFVLAALGLVTVVERLPTLRAAMIAVGGLLMLYFAYGAARDAVSESEFLAAGDGAGETADRSRATDKRGFKKALVLALTNPYQIVFWLTVGIGLLQSGRLDVLGATPYVGDYLAGTVVVRTGSPALLVGFFGGIAGWIVGFPATLVAAGRRVDAVAPAIAVLSAIVLAGFGVVFLADGVPVLVDGAAYVIRALLGDGLAV